MASKTTTTSPDEEAVVYSSLVVDSGPIIRLTGNTCALWKRAQKFYTVPAVLQEIRDAKAREHLDHLPMELIVREASAEGIQAMIDFSRQTGDYPSLSSVDLQVLGLLYDLELAGCAGDMSHVRTTPKRVIGLGAIETIGGGSKNKSLANSNGGRDGAAAADDDDDDYAVEEGVDYVSDSSQDGDDDSADVDPDENDWEADKEPSSIQPTVPLPQKKPAASSWSKVVDPSAKDLTEIQQQVPNAAAVGSVFGRMSFLQVQVEQENEETGGQFSDAEDDPCSLDGDGGFATKEMSVSLLEKELQSDFPSLAAAATVPYDEGKSDDLELVDIRSNSNKEDELQRLQQDEEEARKQQSLCPISKSGKLYNSFRNYGDLMKPGKQQAKTAPLSQTALSPTAPPTVGAPESAAPVGDKNQSRIIGGMTLAGQEIDVEDDGEGWITCASEIRSMKANGVLDPTKNGTAATKPQVLPSGPPACQRAACATTDFAMQNVILQMNLELLSVDGIKVRKLKSFVTRCGACFKVYTSSENTGPLGKRLFCDKCGSDMMQRIAASVDGKTGRLRLHLSKRYKHNLRGTKFSLPKPGAGDRFKGDLLLREDQLLMGAWNQKVKMSSGGKARASAQSMFGMDLASNVGCNAKAVDEDIRVGFGRRNPNSVKGRERRGKKKKTADKACGLRRY